MDRCGGESLWFIFFSVKQVDLLVERWDEEEQLGFQEVESMK